MTTVYTYPLTGSRVFPVNFEYLARRFVVITLVGTTRRELTLNTDYRFTGKMEITTDLAWSPGEYTRMEVRRVTSATDRLVNFTDGSILRSYDLNISQIQAIHIAEEARDVSSSSMLSNTFYWDARGLSIKNMGDPTDQTDAVNLRTLEASIRGTIRSPLGETLSELPQASVRAGKTLTFDAFGQPLLTFPASGSVGEFAADIGNELDPLKGAALVGRGVIVVSSTSALLFQPRKVGSMYATLSYYEGGSKGGGMWKWDPVSEEAADFGNVLEVPGVSIGRFIRIRTSNVHTSYEYGVRASNTGVSNRQRLTAMFRKMHGSANTGILPDEDVNVDMSKPIIVPADTRVVGGKGFIVPVGELPQPPQTSQNNPNGTRNCYGAMFMSGDPVTGLIWMGGANNIYMGTIRFIGVKIANRNKLFTESGYALHGIFCNGGVVIYEDCEINDMPNNGYNTSFSREVHYLRCKGRRNGWLTAGGAVGGAKNGISNTSTYTVTTFVYPVEDRSRIVTVNFCEFTDNKDEGVQYSSWPLVVIQNSDISKNGDRAIEGDTAYVQTTKTRDNDVVHVYNCDLRGKSGETRHCATFNDGYNKDVFLGGNLFGRCTGLVLSTSCTEFGSVTFTSKNYFELDNVGLTDGCHAMYLNAGLIDVRAGGAITGAHSRSALNAVLLAANNDMRKGGKVLVGDFVSDVTFVRAVTGYSKSSFVIRNVQCSTSRSFAQISASADMDTIEISGCDGVMNSSGTATDGILSVGGLDLYSLGRLILQDNLHDVHASTRYPVGIVNPAPPAGKIGKLISRGNYWKGYSFSGGAERLTAVVGLALKTSAMDLPVLS